MADGGDVAKLAQQLTHDVNNPIGVIRLNAATLERAFADLEPMLEEYHQRHGAFVVGGLPSDVAIHRLRNAARGIIEACGRVRDAVQRLDRVLRPASGPPPPSAAEPATVPEAARAAGTLRPEPVSPPETTKPVVLTLGAMLLALVGLLYVGRWSYFQPNNVATIWPSAGVLLAFVVLLPRRVGLGLVGLSMLLQWIVDAMIWGTPKLAALGFSVANGLEPVLCMLIIQAFAGRRRGPVHLAVVTGILVAAMLGTLPSTLIGAYAALIVHPDASVSQVAQTWWCADALAIVLFTPAVLAWARPSPRVPGYSANAIEPVLGTLVIAVIATLVLTRGNSTPGSFIDMPFLLFPAVMWAAFRVQAQLLTLMNVAIAMVAIAAVGAATGPFITGDGTPYEHVLGMQVFLATLAASSLLVAAAVYGQRLGDQLNRGLESQLLEDQKMKAVGEMAAGVSHDLNNLLTVGSAQLWLLRRAMKDAGVSRHDLTSRVDHLSAMLTRGEALTRQLLTMSRQGPHEPEVVSPAELLAHVQPLVQAVVSETIRVDFEATAGVSPVRVDKSELERALLNLAINARDAMPLGGRLRIAAENVELDRAQVVGHDEPVSGKLVRISVADSGHGMAPQVLARIFEPFFTTKPPGKGTGLGLVAVRDAVAHAGGYLAVESLPREGTVVQVYLPRAGDDAPRPTPAPEKPVPSGAGRTVLVCDDDRLVRTAMKDVLEAAGYRVVDATTIEDAKALFGVTPDIDLLVADLSLSGVDGSDLADVLASQRAGLGVLLVSGNAQEARRFQKRGYRFLAKPFSPAALLSSLETLSHGAA